MKIEYHVPCPVDNSRPLRRTLRSAGRSTAVNIRPWNWEMAIPALEPRLTWNCGRQIDASFTNIASGRQSTGPDAGRPNPGTPTAAAPISQPPVSPDFPAGTPLSWPTLRNFLYIPGRCWCTVGFLLRLTWWKEYKSLILCIVPHFREHKYFSVNRNPAVIMRNVVPKR